MADNSYVITLNNNTSKSGSGAVAGQTMGETTPQKAPAIGNATSSKMIAGGLVAYGKVKPWVNRVISHEVSMVELRTGSRELQERSNFTYQIINDGVNMAESIGASLLISGGNPLVALATAGLTVVGKLVNYAQNQNRINTERTVENVGLRQNLIRAGARGSRSEYVNG